MEQPGKVFFNGHLDTTSNGYIHPCTLHEWILCVPFSISLHDKWTMIGNSFVLKPWELKVSVFASNCYALQLSSLKTANRVIISETYFFSS